MLAFMFKKPIQLVKLVVLFLFLANSATYCEIWYKYGGCEKYSVSNSIFERIPTPAGYERIKLYKNSFAEWIRYLPLRPEDSVILTYTGDPLPESFYNVWAVIDIPLYFNRDIEQCADYAYRFWFEYQKEVGFGEDLWLTDYNGNKIYYYRWKRGRENPTLRRFFKWTCDNANSYSLMKGLYEVKEEQNLGPGDIIVQNRSGGIGHVSIIFDVCEDKMRRRLYLIGYSFMPAQECHIEKADENYGVNGWFTLKGYFKYLEEHLPFGRPVLRSFIKQDTIKLTDDVIDDWRNLEVSVRDSKIPVEKAAFILPKIMKRLNKLTKVDEREDPGRWIFPVEGYSISSIGGRGSSFKPCIVYGISPIKGYSFFDGNRHGGHPAHDIFIFDKNRDSLNDRTNKPVYVLAILDGIILSTYSDWQIGSKMRGGNYIWCYHSKEKLVSYYAHLNKILVNPGQKVNSGERLGTIGRTGFSAFPKTSPTHLHLMVLEYIDGEFHPYNYYEKLQ